MNCSNMQRDSVMGNMTPQQFTSAHASECCHSVSYVTYKPFLNMSHSSLFGILARLFLVLVPQLQICMQIVMSMWLFVVFLRDSEAMQGKNMSPSEFYILYICDSWSYNWSEWEHSGLLECNAT
jgi:hypothetical protein